MSEVNDASALPRKPREPARFALIIGGMKCGTTSLFDLLAQHPQIAPSREKEPDFFADNADPIAAWDDYLSLWDWNPEEHQVALEASTQYAKYPWIRDVPERIARVPRDFRFIYVMRDPIPRIESQVRHGVYDGWARSLDEGGLTEDLLDFSRYAMQLDRYAPHFPRESMLLLTLEELKRHPDQVLRRACEHLGVDPNFQFHDAETPRNTGDFYGVPPAVASLARNRAAKWLVGRLLPRPLKHAIRRRLARVGDEEGAHLGRWKLNDDEVALVRRKLADDLARLRDHYGVRATWIPGSMPAANG